MTFLSAHWKQLAVVAATIVGSIVALYILARGARDEEQFSDGGVGSRTTLPEDES